MILLGVRWARLLAVFAPVLVGIFIPSDGVSGRMAVQGVRMFALGLIPCCILNALKSLYQGTGGIGLTETISVLEGAAFPRPAPSCSAASWGVTGAWLYFLWRGALTLLCMAAYVWRKTGRILEARPFLLLDRDFGVEQRENLMEREIRTGRRCDCGGEGGGALLPEDGSRAKRRPIISRCASRRWPATR